MIWTPCGGAVNLPGSLPNTEPLPHLYIQLGPHLPSRKGDSCCVWVWPLWSFGFWLLLVGL